MFLLAGFALLSSGAGAAGLGNIRVRSALGEPFSAVVNVSAAEGESLGTDCFRLADADSADGVRVLRHASLDFRRKGSGGELHIRGIGAETEPLLRLVVRLRCAGEAGSGITREYNALLDPREYKTVSPSPAIATLPVATMPAPSMPPAAVSRAPRVSESGSAKRAAPPARKSEKIARPKDKAASGGVLQEDGFRLQLSTAALDPVRLAVELSEEEKLRLRERLLLIDADDQVAQLMQLKDRIMRLERQLVAASPVASPVAMASVPASAVVSKPHAGKPEAAKSGEGEFPGPWLWGVLAGGGAVVAVFFVWRWRKERAKTLAAERVFELDLDEAEKAGEALSCSAPALPHVLVTEAVASATNQPAQPAWGGGGEVDVFQPDTVLEEVQLLMDHGLARQALDLLEDEIKRRPLFVALWVKLFEACRQAGDKALFAARAQEFRTHFLSDALWHQVQAIGRELDPDNALYREGGDFPTGAQAETAQPAEAEVDFSLEFELPGLDGKTVHEPSPLMFGGDASPLLELPPLDKPAFAKKTAEADYVSDDPVLQEVARMIHAGQRDEACNRLEELLYRGTFEQRMVAAAWLDRLLPIDE